MKKRENNEAIEEVKEALPNIKIMILEPFVLEACSTTEHWEFFHSEVLKRAEMAKKIAEKYNLTFIPLQVSLFMTFFPKDALNFDKRWRKETDGDRFGESHQLPAHWILMKVISVMFILIYPFIDQRQRDLSTVT